MLDEGKHPIQVVARRTGLSPDVIRVWERRYGAVEPHRSMTHRRLYSDQDVVRLQLLRKATMAGRRIGDVARLDTPDLRELVDTDAAAAITVGSQPVPEPVPVAAAAHLQACLAAVESLDSSRLDAALGRARVELSIPGLLDGVLVPLLREVGERWRSGSFRVYHEHLATAMARSVLANLRAANDAGEAGPEIVVTTPEGQHHELGALMVAVMAAAEGWNVTYLGPNLPAEEIAGAVFQRGARAVALSLVYPTDDPRVPEALRNLRRLLPENVVILIGGRAAAAYSAAVDEPGLVTLGDLHQLRDRLGALRIPAAE